MSADDPTPPDPEPEPERRLPALTCCDHCGHRPAVWVCSDCQLKLCPAHRECPWCELEQEA